MDCERPLGVAGRALHGADDVAAFAHRAEGRLGRGGDRPTVTPLLLGEAEPLEFLQAPRQQPAAEASIGSGRNAGQVDSAVAGELGELAVETGPALLVDLAGHALAHLALGLDAELLGGELRAAASQAVTDVVAGDDEIGSGLVDAA